MFIVLGVVFQGFSFRRGLYRSRLVPSCEVVSSRGGFEPHTVVEGHLTTCID